MKKTDEFMHGMYTAPIAALRPKMVQVRTTSWSVAGAIGISLSLLALPVQVWI